MFNNTTKNEFKISKRKIDKVKGNSYVKDVFPYIKKHIFNNITKEITKSSINTLFELWINKATNEYIYSYLTNKSINATQIIFNNDKYSINIYSYDGIYFIIDCFHMNTITMQIYKKLINEIYELLINEKQKNNNYLNKEVDCYFVFFDNIDKLELNKKKVIHSLFCKQLFNNNKIHSIELHYFLNYPDDSFYYSNENRKVFYVDSIHNDKKYNYDELFSLSEKSNFEAKVNIQQKIQKLFCLEKYSVDYINGLYNYMISIINNTNVKYNNKIQLLKQLDNYFTEFHMYNKINTMKHLIYESFIVKIIELYNDIK